MAKGLSSFYEISLTTSKPKPKYYPTELITTGHHILKKRLDMGLSRSQLTKMLDVKEVTIWGWENTVGTPVIHFFPKIIEFLGYDPLFDNSETLKAKIENYRRLHGISYRNLSKRIGMSYNVFLKFVNGKNVSKKSVETIEQFFEEPSI